MYYKGYVFKQELNHFLIDDLGQKLRSFANIAKTQRWSSVSGNPSRDYFCTCL